jgi:VanZ family protein
MAEHIHIKKALIYWIATIGYMGLIFALSSQNQFGFFLPENGDKVMHILAYMPLGFLLHMSLRMSGISRYVFAAAVLLASIYGITDELHQSFVPGRFASTGDIAADILGAIMGSIGASLFSHGMS